MTENGAHSCLHNEPTSLKEALEFCSGLINHDGVHQTRLKNVLQQIKRNVDKYYFSEFGFDGTDGSIALTIRRCHGILQKLIVKEKAADHNLSGDLPHCESIYHRSTTLQGLVPRLFGTLYFLHFMCNNTEFGSVGGGAWSTLTSLHGHHNLQRWLADRDEPSGSSKGKILQRRFHDEELNKHTTVERLTSEEIGQQQLIAHTHVGVLQRCMIPMIFVCQWHRGQTAHTLIFLREFVHKLHDGTLKDERDIGNPLGLRNSINSCHIGIQMLFEALPPVCMKHNKLYHATLRSDYDSFQLYYDWIKHNISYLIESLGEMKADCELWNQNNLIRGKSYGPFPWGFVFKDATWVNGQNQFTLVPLVEKVMEDLNNLRDIMNDEPEQTAASGEQLADQGFTSRSTSDVVPHYQPTSGDGTRLATVVAVGALFFSIWYLLNI